MAKKFLLEDLPDPGLQLRLLAHSMVVGVVDASDGRGQKYVVTQLGACAAPGWGLEEATETSCSNRRKLRPDKENGQLHTLGSTQRASILEVLDSTRALRAIVGLQLCFD